MSRWNWKLVRLISFRHARKGQLYLSGRVACHEISVERDSDSPPSSLNPSGWVALLSRFEVLLGAPVMRSFTWITQCCSYYLQRRKLLTRFVFIEKLLKENMEPGDSECSRDLPCLLDLQSGYSQTYSQTSRLQLNEWAQAQTEGLKQLFVFAVLGTRSSGSV